MLSGLKNVALSDGEIRSVRGWLTWGSAYLSADPNGCHEGAEKFGPVATFVPANRPYRVGRKPVAQGHVALTKERNLLL